MAAEAATIREPGQHSASEDTEACKGWFVQGKKLGRGRLNSNPPVFDKFHAVRDYEEKSR